MNKYFYGFSLGVSVLPALLVMPAMAVNVANVADFNTALTNGGNINLTEDIVFNGGMPVVADTVIDGTGHGVTAMTFSIPAKTGSVNAYQGTLAQGAIAGIDDVFYYANSTLAVGNKIYSDSGKTNEVGTVTFKSGTVYSVGAATTATLTRDPSQDVFTSNKTYLAFTTSSNKTVYAYINGANKTEADLTASTYFYSTAATTSPVGLQGATLVEGDEYSTNQYDTFSYSLTGKPHDIYEINGDTVYSEYNKTPTDKTRFYSGPALTSGTEAYVVSGDSVWSFKNNFNVAVDTDLTLQNIEFSEIKNPTTLEKGGIVYSDNSASETKNNITLNNVVIQNNIVGSGLVYTKNSNLVASNIEATNNTGGVFYILGSDANISGTFIGNHALSGGAIDVTSGSNLTISGLFQENYASTNVANAAGAVNSAQGALTILDGTQFKNNYSKNAGAGAVNVSGLSTTPGKGGYLTVGNNVIFDGNTAGYESFDSNVVTKATANGGAMVIGALMESPTFGTGVKFKNNRAANQGGALALTGAAADDNGMIFNNGIEFDNNSASQGGAFAITANIKTTLDGLSFTNNHANGGDNAIGGALVVSGNVTNQTTPENAASKVKTLTITNTSFEDNLSDTAGGAIGQTMITAFNGSKYSQGMTIDILNSTFTDNTAGAEGGAIISDAILNVTGSTFTGNQTTGTVIGVNSTDSNEGGGAIFMYDDSVATITNSTFTSNESGTWGGAISTRGISSAQPGANSSLAVNGGTFTANNAVYGGAVANSLRNTVGEGNVVTKYGARINGVTFTGNTATTNGGAIYNVGDITLAGTNTFTGNTANGLANDIHNVGALTVESGTTTMDGGITGDGTLSIANGATLNVGTSTIEQGTVTLDGTMLATLRDGDAQITAGTFDGNGTLKLSFAGEGTYHVFGNAAFRAAGIEATSSVYDITWAENNKDMVVSIKSAADIAEQNDIEQDAAKAIVGLNASTSEKLNDLGIKIQEKLAEGTPEAKHEVEHAAKAVHPEKESVTQSVATSVQNTVTNLASARMAAPTFGRAGGDITMTSGGVWAQGLFNKSKQNDAFRGYTRGIAAGLDGTMNRVWTVGAGYSYAHSDISGSVRDTEIDSNTVFLYGQYKPAAWYVNAVANYTMSDYSEEGDAMGTPVTADYDVDALGMAVAAGYDLDFGLTPELGLRYMHVMADDYTNSLGVKTKSDNTNFLTGVLGAKYAFNVVADKYTTFVPQLNAAIKYDMLSDKNVATITMPGVDAYTLDVERLSRFGGEFGIGLGMKHRGMDFSINYDIDVRKDYISQTGMLKFRYNF